MKMQTSIDERSERRSLAVWVMDHSRCLLVCWWLGVLVFTAKTECYASGLWFFAFSLWLNRWWLIITEIIRFPYAAFINSSAPYYSVHCSIVLLFYSGFTLSSLGDKARNDLRNDLACYKNLCALCEKKSHRFSGYGPECFGQAIHE